MNDRSQPDDFYIGYQPAAPHGLARWVRRVVVGLFVGVAGLAAALAWGQGGFPPAHFEYDIVRPFEGQVRASPYPALVVQRPGITDVTQSLSRYPLTVFGKHGANLEVAGFDGESVALRGSLIYRNDRTMIEVETGSVEPAASTQRLSPSVVESLGQVTVTGEIVDSKCFLGVMNPGDLKPHRACATRCISGGVPPMLVVRDEHGPVEHLLLANALGGPVNRDVLSMVAEMVEITGALERHDDVYVLKADPLTYRRIP